MQPPPPLARPLAVGGVVGGGRDGEQPRGEEINGAAPPPTLKERLLAPAVPHAPAASALSHAAATPDAACVAGRVVSGRQCSMASADQVCGPVLGSRRQDQWIHCRWQAKQSINSRWRTSVGTILMRLKCMLELFCSSSHGAIQYAETMSSLPFSSGDWR